MKDVREGKEEETETEIHTHTQTHIHKKMKNHIDLHIHRKFGSIIGVQYPRPLNNEKKSKCRKILWNLYVYIPCATMFVELLSQTVQIVLSIENIEILTTCTLSTIYVLQLIFKLMVFKKNENLFQDIFDETIDISIDLKNNPLDDDTFIEFYNKHYSLIKKITIYKGIIQLSSNLGLHAIFCTLSWIGMKRDSTAAFSWTPYDSSKNPEYTYTVLFETFCYGFVTARGAVVDFLFLIMIVVPTIQLNYLKYLLKLIFQEQTQEILNSKLQWWIKQHQRILK